MKHEEITNFMKNKDHSIAAIQETKLSSSSSLRDLAD